MRSIKAVSESTCAEPTSQLPAQRRGAKQSVAVTGIAAARILDSAVELPYGLRPSPPPRICTTMCVIAGPYAALLSAHDDLMP